MSEGYEKTTNYFLYSNQLQLIMKTQILLSVSTDTTFIGHTQVTKKAEAASDKIITQVSGENLSKRTQHTVPGAIDDRD